MILDMGVDIRYDTPVAEPEGAARRRGLRRRVRRHGRAARQGPRHPRAATKRPTRSTSASTGSSRSPSATSTTIGERVLIIGVGNTAMDCCRTARRLGGKDVKVMARRAAQVLQGLAVGARGRRGGAGRDRRQPRARSASCSRAASSTAWSSSAPSRTSERQAQADVARRRHPARPTTSSSPSGRRTRSPGSSATSASSSTSGTCPMVDKKTFQSTRAGRLLRRRRGVGPGEHHLGRRARARGGDLDPQPLPGRRAHRAAGRRA